MGKTIKYNNFHGYRDNKKRTNKSQNKQVKKLNKNDISQEQLDKYEKKTRCSSYTKSQPLNYNIPNKQNCYNGYRCGEISSCQVLFPYYKMYGHPLTYKHNLRIKPQLEHLNEEIYYRMDERHPSNIYLSSYMTQSQVVDHNKHNNTEINYIKASIKQLNRRGKLKRFYGHDKNRIRFNIMIC